MTVLQRMAIQNLAHVQKVGFAAECCGRELAELAAILLDEEGMEDRWLTDMRASSRFPLDNDLTFGEWLEAVTAAATALEDAQEQLRAMGRDEG